MNRLPIALALLLLPACSCHRAAATPAAPALTASADPIYSVKDNGKRCFAAPCASWTATDSAGVAIEISGFDLSALKLAPNDESKTRESLQSGKTRAAGSIRTVPKAGPAGDGTVLVVTRLVP